MASKNRNSALKELNRRKEQALAQKETLIAVPSLLDAMKDGNEYGSIVSVFPKPGVDLVDDVIRGIKEIQAIRNRPCLAYVGNVVKRDDPNIAIDPSDDLPFSEAVNKVAAAHRKIDVFLATVGGSGHQVTRFVNFLRPRFDEVDFLIPSFCMSAGTLFALSGDRIWMTERACLGPTDPQVPSAAGRFVPAQALLLLVQRLQETGDAARKNGMPIPWTAIRIIDSLDKKELGDAITATNYSTMMATQFLRNHKFKHWAVRETSQIAVDDAYRETRANEIATALASHDRWKSHGHAISREILWSEIKLKIDHPAPDLRRAMDRLWAMMNWMFDKTTTLKMIVSEDYRYLRNAVVIPGKTP